MFPKTPYRLELWDNDDDDADYPVLGMPERLRLGAARAVPRQVVDPRGVGRTTSGPRLGLYAPRYAFVEVYVNRMTGR